MLDRTLTRGKKGKVLNLENRLSERRSIEFKGLSEDGSEIILEYSTRNYFKKSTKELRLKAEIGINLDIDDKYSILVTYVR